MARKAASLKIVNDITNGAQDSIKHSEPYTVRTTIEGSSDYIFHRWNCEAVDEKSRAAKNSAAKKTDDVETYVWRDKNGYLCIPGEHMRGTICASAKFLQDPRSPRKSAFELYKAGVVVTTALASLGKKEWDYLDTRRAVVQRNAINRVRPAMFAGYQVWFDIMVILPEYIDQNTLRKIIEQAGRVCGIGDNRPTYGRFGIVKYELLR